MDYRALLVDFELKQMNGEVETPESHLDHGCKERLADYLE